MNNQIKDIKIVSKELVRQLGKSGQKPLTQTNFSVLTLGMMGYRKTHKKTER
jgi:signal recognition particle GTPase